ncbi:MAG: NADP-dependent phosphogluconate dehydrogenase [Desulfitobacteriaceae bacterium]
MQQKFNVGLIGLAVMGENLALNLERNGYSVAVFNRSISKVDEFLVKATGKNFGGAHSPEEFVNLLEKPRKIIIMVKAGRPVDEMIEKLTPHLDPGDLLIDCGNSFFEDTRRRSQELAAQGLRFLGIGVSGGEEGALNGPSIMIGGPEEAFAEVEEMFRKISAKVDGDPCSFHFGPDGAGHYVKTVHNGIEYADMQLIAETYHLLKEALGLNAEETGAIFHRWNQGDLESYLIEITGDIFARRDKETGRPLVEMILDQAGQKGTGKWTSQSALELGVPTPTITEAVFARLMSSLKKERIVAAEHIKVSNVPYTGDKEAFIRALHDALYSAKICCYAQGFALLKAASRQYCWNLNFGEIAMVWRGGCIIRAKFLNRIKEAFDRDKDLPNLLLDPFFLDILQSSLANWRLVVSSAKQLGIPTPSLSASLDYFDSYRQATLPANLIQAQRDYFGAHTYERIDKPGIFHTEWIEN